MGEGTEEGAKRRPFPPQEPGSGTEGGNGGRTGVSSLPQLRWAPQTWGHILRNTSHMSMGQALDQGHSTLSMSVDSHSSL